ncbi:Sarcolemmal membrane-associated protein [Colletotrichum sidae]|uniref:Sarcolemmal membrane-associated protein n=1 Tax=Colletotrichum sidae TaxID=1347389 RepID=A0A4R8TGA4_9PEZI|nr:Sarcolemmal membrane-associated protein [Colletotrichum sidae]
MASGHIQQARDVLVTVSCQHNDVGAEFPERRIFLTSENIPSPVIKVGRASKRVPALEPKEHNCYFDSPVMSRHHAELDVDWNHKKIFVTDCSSLHGTYKNSQRLLPKEPYDVLPGDTLKFGIDVQRSNDLYPPCTVVVDYEFDHAMPKITESAIRSSFKVPDVSDTSDDGEDEEDFQPTIERLRLMEQEHSHGLVQNAMPKPIDLTDDCSVQGPEADLPPVIVIDDEIPQAHIRENVARISMASTFKRFPVDPSSDSLQDEDGCSVTSANCDGHGFSANCEGDLLFANNCEYDNSEPDSESDGESYDDMSGEDLASPPAHDSEEEDISLSDNSLSDSDGESISADDQDMDQETDNGSDSEVEDLDAHNLEMPDQVPAYRATALFSNLESQSRDNTAQVGPDEMNFPANPADSCREATNGDSCPSLALPTVTQLNEARPRVDTQFPQPACVNSIRPACLPVAFQTLYSPSPKQDELSRGFDATKEAAKNAHEKAASFLDQTGRPSGEILREKRDETEFSASRENSKAQISSLGDIRPWETSQPAEEPRSEVTAAQPKKVAFTAVTPKSVRVPESAWAATGNRFLNTPQELPRPIERTTSPELDMASAFQYNQSKVAAAAAETSTTPQIKDTVVEPLQEAERPKSPKRKADEISTLLPEEEAVEAASSAHLMKDSEVKNGASAATPIGQPAETSCPAPLSGATTGNDEQRPSKRSRLLPSTEFLRSVSGGVMFTSFVIGYLASTAPSL